MSMRAASHPRLVAVIVAVIAAMALRPAHAAPTPLRDVDWGTVLAADPHIEVRPDVPALVPTAGPYLIARINGAEVAGYPLLEDVRYGDIDGDGAEEAVILLNSGGTAGIVGLLVYHEAEDAPRLVAAVSGYKLDARFRDGALVVRRPYYEGVEPNCCPTAAVSLPFVLDGDDLLPTIDPEPLMTVARYYGAIAAGRYADAYEFLTPAFQATLPPFDAWAAGFATTDGFFVEITPGASEREAGVDITSQDRLDAGDTVRRHFTGSWSLAYDLAGARWLLDAAAISPAP